MRRCRIPETQAAEAFDVAAEQAPELDDRRENRFDEIDRDGTATLPVGGSAQHQAGEITVLFKLYIDQWIDQRPHPVEHARGVAQRRAGREKRADVRQVVERESLAEPKRKKNGRAWWRERGGK